MRTVLIYHEDDIIDRDITARWLASFSDLAGLVILRENSTRMKTRVKREIKRVGLLRFLDVLAFRLYYKFVLSERDQKWKEETADHYRKLLDDVENVPLILASSPNSQEVRQFLEETRPDIVIARCKTILRKEIFSLAKTGTFVLHPGICPEYRNAHGCFWALAENDDKKVGLTLLKIDEGVDTGPIYGYFSYDFDPEKESHIRIQNRVFIENLGNLSARLTEVWQGKASPIRVEGRDSKTWGQPWLSKYLRIKNRANSRFLKEDSGSLET
ncbi:MAG: formyl transferase [Acidobacteria bacterium]|nr:formyl transferase [Acidobacteriota bacterium]